MGERAPGATAEDREMTVCESIEMTGFSAYMLYYFFGPREPVNANRRWRYWWMDKPRPPRIEGPISIRAELRIEGAIAAAYTVK